MGLVPNFIEIRVAFSEVKHGQKEDTTSPTGIHFVHFLERERNN
jgi:hypothetical protein